LLRVGRGWALRARLGPASGPARASGAGAHRGLALVGARHAAARRRGGMSSFSPWGALDFKFGREFRFSDKTVLNESSSAIIPLPHFLKGILRKFRNQALSLFSILLLSLLYIYISNFI
jgi:hypothetical protein